MREREGWRTLGRIAWAATLARERAPQRLERIIGEHARALLQLVPHDVADLVKREEAALVLIDLWRWGSTPRATSVATPSRPKVECGAGFWLYGEVECLYASAS